MANDTAFKTRFNLDGIPNALRRVKGWILRTAGKVPIDEHGRSVGAPKLGRLRLSLDQAIERMERLNRRPDAEPVGLGLVPIEVTMLDIDCYKVDVSIESERIACLLHQLGTYAELSPSGKGVRVIWLGTLDHPKNEQFELNGIPVQLFCASGGYATVTGQVLWDCGEVRELLPTDRDRILEWLDESRADAPHSEPQQVAWNGTDLGIPMTLEGASDRSARIAELTVEMLQRGYSPEDVLATLAGNSEVMAVAAEHWPRNPQGYLETQHVGKLATRFGRGNGALTEDDWPDYTQETTTTGEEVQGHRSKLTPWFRPMGALADRARAPEWVVEGVFERGEVVLLTGNTAMGKTFVGIDMAAHIADGRPWFGCATSGARVAYLAGEGFKGFRRRLAGFRAHRFDTPRLLVAQHLVDLASPEGRALVLAQIRELPDDVGVLIVDTLSRYSSAEENDNVAMAQLMAWFQDKVARVHRMSVIVVHHPRKDDPDGLPRGAGAIMMNADILLTVTPLERDGQEVPGVRRLRSVMARDVPESFDRLYRIEGVHVAEGEYQTAVVEAVDDEEVEMVQQAGAQRPITQREQVVLDVLRAGDMTKRQVREALLLARPAQAWAENQTAVDRVVESLRLHHGLVVEVTPYRGGNRAAVYGAPGVLQ